MFTEPGTWFRWGCIFAAALVAVMPSTTVFRGFAARLQAQVDGLVQPPAIPVPAMPPPAVPGRRPDEAQLREGGPATDTRRPGEGEPDPTATAARLVEEQRQRQPNDMLWDSLQRAERAIGLFVASLIPGVGERHVRAREEARREAERVERERIERERVAAEEEEARKKEEEEKGKKKVDKADGDGGGEMDECSGDAEEKGQMTEASSAAIGGERKGKERAVEEEPSIQV